jgi:5-methylcytosine-specific restriction endonuclease McrA
LKEILRDVELEIEKRGITPEEVSETISSIPPLLNRRIIMGYASVAMVDRENQKISIEALRDAVKRFMADGRYRIISIFHSDAVVGRVLPKWTDPKTGKSYETEVDNVGWKVVCLAPETEVYLNKKGERKWSYQPITQAEVGDRVATHLGGDSHFIMKTMSRDISEEINVLYLEGGVKVRVTDEHPILTTEGWKKAKDIARGDTLIKLIDLKPGMKNKLSENMKKLISDGKIGGNPVKGYSISREFFNDQKYYDALKKEGVRKNQFTKLNVHTYDEAYGIEKAKDIKAKQIKFHVSDISFECAKKEILAERKYECEKCKSKNFLQVHHIDNNRFNNEKNNLEILCAQCHADTKKKPYYSIGKEHRACLFCGDAFETIRTSKSKFCSLNCYYHWMKGKSKQEISALRDMKINSIDAKTITYKKEESLRDRVLERDGKKCAKCNSSDDLVVHHFLPEDTEDAVITLCRKCHHEAHQSKTLLPAVLSNGTKVVWAGKEHYTGKVYNLEIETANSYAGRGLIFHNCELRDDIELAEKVWDEIIKGNLRSFSVAGTSKKKHNETSTGNPFTEIDELDLLECTICSVPVNPMSMFQVLWEGKDRIAI